MITRLELFMDLGEKTMFYVTTVEVVHFYGAEIFYFGSLSPHVSLGAATSPVPECMPPRPGRAHSGRPP